MFNYSIAKKYEFIANLLGRELNSITSWENVQRIENNLITHNYPSFLSFIQEN